MVDEKITDVEETEEVAAEEVNESEDVVCPDEEICEDDKVEEGSVQEADEEVADTEKKSSNKGLIVNAILTGLMLIVLVANLIVSFGNSDKIKALESELADTKEVLSYALTGSPYSPLDFAEIAGKLREERKVFEEAMEGLEDQQTPAEEDETAPADGEESEAPAENQ